MKIKGSCLCKKIQYQITGHPGIFQYCHCSRCRKFTGSAHASNIFVKPDQFKWTKGEEFVGRYELPEGKYYATCFCKNCGSSLPWLSRSGQVVVIPAGTLDDDPEIKPQQNIFWASRAPWYVDVCDLVKYEALPDKK